MAWLQAREAATFHGLAAARLRTLIHDFAASDEFAAWWEALAYTAALRWEM
jgi:hypothetical protein